MRSRRIVLFLALLAACEPAPAQAVRVGAEPFSRMIPWGRRFWLSRLPRPSRRRPDSWNRLGSLRILRQCDFRRRRLSIVTVALVTTIAAHPNSVPAPFGRHPAPTGSTEQTDSNTEWHGREGEASPEKETICENAIAKGKVAGWPAHSLARADHAEGMRRSLRPAAASVISRADPSPAIA
jgi:hypothetical protein